MNHARSAPEHGDPKTKTSPIYRLLFHIRSFLFQIYLALSVLVCGLIGLPLLLVGKSTIPRFCQSWCHIVLFGLRWICGIRHQVTGQEHLPNTGAVIAANHQSMWETIMVYAILKKPVMVLKEELLKIPLFGLWLKASGAIALDRSAGAKAMRTLINQAKKSTAQGGQIIIFPEGTRTPPGKRTSLKPGIAGIYTASNVPCIPIGHDSGRHWQYPGGLKTPGTITLNIGPAIEANLPRHDFMDQLDKAITRMRPDLPSISSPS